MVYLGVRGDEGLKVLKDTKWPNTNARDAST